MSITKFSKFGYLGLNNCTKLSNIGLGPRILANFGSFDRYDITLTAPSVHTIRFQSTSAKEKLKASKLTKRIFVYKHNESKKKPLVLILSWMLARRKHMEKYVEIFKPLGMDVMVVYVSPLDLLLPQIGGRRNATHIMKYIENSDQNVILYAFSVGAYQHGECLIHMEHAKKNYLAQKYIGQIYDSAVEYYGLASGVARAVSTNPWVYKSLEYVLRSYLFLTYPIPTMRYKEVSKFFHGTVITSPSQFFVSEDDIVGNPTANKIVAKEWETNGQKVFWKCWQNSQHVSHMYHHGEEYKEILHKFLEYIGAVSPKSKKT